MEGNGENINKRKVPTMPEIATNGPRQISDLLQTDVWRVNAMAYFMGHANLPYLPPSLRNVLINVGSGLSYDYMVPANAEEINGAEITHHQSLIHRINSIQHLPQSNNIYYFM